MSKEKLIEVWKIAAADLKIEIISPFVLKTKNDTELSFLILVKDFGRKLGTVIFSTEDMSDIKSLENYGYYYSALNPLIYSQYNRDLFIDTLKDWGYFGEEFNQPSWYSGNRGFTDLL